MTEIDIEIYEALNGKRPFEEWIKDLREVHTRVKILTRIYPFYLNGTQKDHIQSLLNRIKSSGQY